MFKNRIFILLFLVICCVGNITSNLVSASCVTEEDKIRAAIVQQKIINDIKRKKEEEDAKKKEEEYKKKNYSKNILSINVEIDQIKRQIDSNESEIKKLESTRSDLDGDLAVLLQNLEYYRVDPIQYFKEISDTKNKIQVLNNRFRDIEQRINFLVKKRENLDNQLAVKLQLLENMN